MKKYMSQIMAMVKIVWNEREDLVEAIAEKARRSGTAAQRYTLVGLIAVLCMVVAARVATETEPPVRTELASMSYEQSIVEEQQRAEAQKALQIAHNREEAEYVARVLYGTALYNSDEGKEAVVWLIINRCESSIFPDSIIEVCKQPNQFMGYSDDNPVLTDLYNLADGVLNNWRNGGYRIMSPDYLYMSWSSDEIVLRTTFEETSRTHYWRA